MQACPEKLVPVVLAGQEEPQHRSRFLQGHSGSAGGEVLKVPLAAAAAAAVATRWVTSPGSTDVAE